MKFIKVYLFFLLLFGCNKEVENQSLNEQNNIFEDSKTLHEIDVPEVKKGILKFVDSSITLDEKLYGFWNTDYPVSSGINGYYFSEYGYFVYFNYGNEENISAKYDGSIGIWFVESGTIYIDHRYSFYWKDDYVKTPFGYTIKNDNELIRKSYSDKKLKIGILDDVEKIGNMPLQTMFRPLDLQTEDNDSKDYYKIYSVNKFDFDVKRLNEMDVDELYTHTMDKLMFSN